MTRQVCTTIAPSDRADRTGHMNVWQAVWRLVRFAPWLFVANALIWIVEDFFYLAPGLVLRQIFDTLTDHAQLNVGFWALLALLPALSGLQTLLVVGGTATGATFHGTVGALLRKNLLARILRRPGARALPGSPGEAVSRFGGDVAEITGLSEDVVDSFGNIAAAVVALVPPRLEDTGEYTCRAVNEIGVDVSVITVNVMGQLCDVNSVNRVMQSC